MIDLETLGTVPVSVILSIGAVCFNSLSNEIGPKLHIKINIQDSLNQGFTTQKSTIEWWGKQDSEASNLLEECVNSTITVRRALTNFQYFLMSNTDPEKVCVWGCGSDFDNVLLSSTYHHLNMMVPWKYNNNRCYRTVKSIFPDVMLERTGTHHNALDDALFQTQHLLKIFHNN